MAVRSHTLLQYLLLACHSAQLPHCPHPGAGAWPAACAAASLPDSSLAAAAASAATVACAAACQPALALLPLPASQQHEHHISSRRKPALVFLMCCSASSVAKCCWKGVAGRAAMPDRAKAVFPPVQQLPVSSVFLTVTCIHAACTCCVVPAVVGHNAARAC